ncbi:LacI family transcriptional regulator [Candidatus Gracilibacteria bacterium]|nr:LacI family transcriptional regulator [Candidatus Gracilibacteria bacterium]
MSSVNMELVAQMADVSIATVSRVINSPERVAAATRERVLAVMRQLGYRYNAVAGGLSRQQTKTLGVIVPTIVNPIFAESTRGIQAVAQANGYALLTGITDYSADEEARLVETFGQHRVDGLLVTSSHVESPELIAAQRAGTPVVLTYSSRLRSPLPLVGVDNAAAAANAVGHLLRLGHRRIAMLAGSFGISDRSFARYQGYTAALAAFGVTVDAMLLAEVPYTLEGGLNGVQRLLALDERPTAIFCSNDLLASVALRAVLDVGLAVPTDLSIIGFDDSPLAAFMNPRLTTVYQPAYEMGRRACELLLRIIGGEQPLEQRIILPTELRVRETTAPPQAL